MYQILSNSPLFKGLTADKIKGLLNDDNYTITDYNAGQFIARKDTSYSGLMIILEGRVEAKTNYENGKQLHIDSLSSPQLIAPAFLFGGYNRLPVDVVAETPVRILTLHRGLLFELMQENVVVLSNFIDIISNRADAWSKKILLLSIKSLEAKVASYLLDHTTEEKPTTEIPDACVTADYFSTTRNAVITTLESLRKRSIITLSGSKVHVHNRQALQDILRQG